MLENYLRIGSTEIANPARLLAYLESVGSGLTSLPEDACGCPTFTADLVGDDAYTDPVTDGAPWWDPDVPMSAEFAGLMVLSVEGMDTNPLTREVTNAVTGGGALGPARAQPRTITVTGVLLGSTCCGVDYGLQWLGAALEGCSAGGGDDCSGDCLVLYDCCPTDTDTGGPELFNAEHRLTLRRVALSSGPNVTARAGDGCPVRGGECAANGADMLTVEFVLTAATPWKWTDPVPVLDVPPPTSDDSECVEWCVHDGDTPCEGCRLAECADPGAACQDPACRPATPPVPNPPETCFCLPIAADQACYDVDLSDRPRWFPDLPMITIRAGSRDLRNVTVRFYERTAAHAGLTAGEVADLERCNPHSEYTTTYVPASGALVVDGQVQRGIMHCNGTCESSTTLWGADGAPPSWRPFDCAEYVMCVESDGIVPPASDAAVVVAVTGRRR